MKMLKRFFRWLMPAPPPPQPEPDLLRVQSHKRVPTREELEIKIEAMKGGFSCLRLLGIVNSTTATEVEKSLQALLSAERYRLLVDLTEVPYVSSRGWGAMISIVKTVRNHDGDIKIFGMRSNVAHLFRQAGLGNIFESLPNLSEAVNAFSRP